MNIVDFIPIGSKHAITREKLCNITGYPDRKIRELITLAGTEHIIINLQDGNGYFIPADDEKVLIERYYHQEKSRLKANEKKVLMLERYLNEQ